MKNFINDFISFLLIFTSILLFYLILFTRIGASLSGNFGLIVFIFPFYLFIKAIQLNFDLNKKLFYFIMFFCFSLLIFNSFLIINFNITIYNIYPEFIEIIFKIQHYKLIFNLFYISIFLLSISFIIEYLITKKNYKNTSFKNRSNNKLVQLNNLLSYDSGKKTKGNLSEKNLVIDKIDESIANTTNNHKNNIISQDGYNLTNTKDLFEDNLIPLEKIENKKNDIKENDNFLNNSQFNSNSDESKKNIDSKLINTTINNDLNNKNLITNNSEKTNENYFQIVENLLNNIDTNISKKPDETKILNKGKIIEKTLLDFGIKSELINFHIGPVVTRFEFIVDEKINLSKIEKIEKNISYNLSAEKIRILAPIPGKKAVGFEVPNDIKEIVRFKDFLSLKDYKSSKYELPLILGKDIDGIPYVIDLTETPHMLIAGRTGSGKSVCINSLINSLILKKSPDELRIILIDPKRVELSLYEELPHLLSQVLVYPDEAALSLKWLVNEMENRYNKLKENKVRNIKDYNAHVSGDEKIPYLVLIIDEFYALIQVAQKTIEDSLIRLSAMARAVGIHLIFATQRPSSDVITGVIKSNLPTRISFQTSSKTDSRIILDINGAESLLGNGDMLFSLGGLPPVRIQGAYISTPEVQNIVEFIKKHYKDFKKKNIIEEIKNIENNINVKNEQFDEPLYEQAIEIIKNERRVSASYLQRRLKIGYNRASRIIEKMEEDGFIGPLKGNKERDILI